jgi:type I restriction-modification system DNA methylase subunit
MNDLEQEAQAPDTALEEGKVFDYITGEPVKDSAKEQVRQRIERAIIHEYGIAHTDMEPDFKVKIGGKNRKLDIAIFRPGTEHTTDNLYRAVVVEKEPKLGTKGAYRMRDPEEARKEFEGLETVMAEVANEEITLSDRALAFIVSELSRYDFGRTDVDAKGAAYQEIVGTNLRGDRGQYFTPRGAIRLVVQMLAPKEHERVLDSSCGTGGFLVEVLNYLNKAFHEAKHVKAGDENTEEFISIRDRLANYATHKLFGVDFDPFLVRAAQMNVMMAGNSLGHLYHMNSLEFPAGHLPGVKPARDEIPLGSVDLIMSAPTVTPCFIGRSRH